MVPAILAMTAGEFKQRFVVVSNCGSLGIQKQTLLLGFCLLGDKKLRALLKFLYTEKAFRSHELALLPQVGLYRMYACSTTMQYMEQAGDICPPGGGRNLVVGECRLADKHFSQFSSSFSNPFILALWFSGGKPGLFSNPTQAQILFCGSGLPRQHLENTHWSLIPSRIYSQYLLGTR